VRLAALHQHYDAFIFDLWGVLHNGIVLYPESLAVLQGLRKAGKAVGIISNSPRPVAAAALNIAQKFALSPALYDALLTSGQLAYEMLRDRPDAWAKTLGTRCLTIGPEHETAPYLALGLQPAACADAADFVLVTGLQAGRNRLENYAADLAAWRAAGLPLVCANPDRQVMRGHEHGIAGGALAAAYAALGGSMRDDFGKPHTTIFERMLATLKVQPQRALMIGDNLHTDIQGAQAVGMASLWITGGVHAPELAAQTISDTAALAAYAAGQGLHPTYHMPMVR
jgi:HAD superfamily hydrolase (TIGR01459 family)